MSFCPGKLYEIENGCIASDMDGTQWFVCGATERIFLCVGEEKPSFFKFLESNGNIWYIDEWYENKLKEAKCGTKSY